VGCGQWRIEIALTQATTQISEYNFKLQDWVLNSMKNHNSRLVFSPAERMIAKKELAWLNPVTKA
jgi:hypothetical protein